MLKESAQTHLSSKKTMHQCPATEQVLEHEKREWSLKPSEAGVHN